MTTETRPAEPQTDAPATGEMPTLDDEQITIPDVLPVLPLRQTVIFPNAIAPILVGQERSKRLVDDAMRANRLIALVAQKNAELAQAGPADLYEFGTVATIHQLARSPDGSMRMAVQGLERVRVDQYTTNDPYLIARLDPRPDKVEDEMQSEALRTAVIDLLRTLLPMLDRVPAEVMMAAEALTDPRQVGYLVASVIPMDLGDREEILELDPVEAKLRKLIDAMQHEVAVRELGRKIATDTQERLSKQQREMLLREQLRSIQDELGEGEGHPELAELRKRLDERNLPPDARSEVDRELQRLATIPEMSPEHGMIRSYLEWIATLPWSTLTGGQIDVSKAREILDRDHYDLEKIKERILEYLAVRKLREERNVQIGETGPGELPADEAGPLPTTERQERSREPILCFVGPPGVGKTSLGQSIAHALGRQFVRMSLGGVRDEAEIRGHRRTYIGAMPGRIIQAIRRAGTRDPVFMLDEIDKVGADWRGDPTAALLEVLDPAQNNTFTDTYLGVPFDLSQVLFIATANTLDTIPAPLQDRMEVLSLAGYTEDEKVNIAKQYLVPQQIHSNGLTDAEITFTDDALRLIVRGYTREAGVRDLDRQIASVCRKVARAVAESGADTSIEITEERVREYLGRRRFFHEAAERSDRPGVATGLAWTPVGGEVLFVEAAMVPASDGEQPLIMTGMLGDVRRESAMAALTFVRSEAHRFGIDPAVFEGKRVHVHVPAGAIPKDGPSAGVAMVTAIASLALGRPVAQEVAMTGEITLRGKVMPVGGIKEKVLAAHRAEIRTVILPRRNEADLDDVPDELRQELDFVFADTVDQVLERALGVGPTPAREAVAAAG
jgi:ATP-dependent Lon protease